MSDTRSPASTLVGLARNLAFATASSGSAVLVLAVLVLAGRRLGEAVFGQFSFALALATVGESVMDWGLHQVAIRAVAREGTSASAVFRNSIALKFGPSVAMVIALTLVGAAIRSEPDVRAAVALLAVSAAMRSYLLTVRGVLQGLEHFSWDAVIMALDRTFLLVASAVVLFAGGRLIALGWAFVAARTLALAIAFLIARRHVGSLRPMFDTAYWQDLGQQALPLGAFLIMLNLYSYVDTLMLSVMRTDAETGLYNAAYRIFEGVTYAAAVLSAVLTPRLSAEFVQQRARFVWLARLGLVVSASIAAVLAIGTALLAAFGLRLLFGAPYVEATRALQILAIGLVVVFPVWILQAIAIATSSEAVLLRTTAIGIAVNVGANLVLIPSAGRQGAAIATVLGETVSFLLLLRGLAWTFSRRPA